MLRQISKLEKKNKELDPETIKNSFPDDEELLKDVIKMKQRQKEEEKKRKLDNYEEEEDNEDEDEKVNKTFSMQNGKNRNRKIDEDDDEDYKVRQRKETYLDEYNKRVREHNKNIVKGTSKSIAIEKNISEPSKTEDNYKSVKVMNSQNINKNRSNIIPLTNAELKTQPNNNREKSNTNRIKNYKSMTKKRDQGTSNNLDYVEFRNKKISLPEISNYKKPKKLRKSETKKNVKETKTINATNNRNKDNTNKENKSKTIIIENNNNNNKETINNENIINPDNNNNANNIYLTSVDVTKQNSEKDKASNYDDDKVSAMTINVEKEIETKVEQYKAQLNNNFLKVLEDGRIADEKRYEKIEKEKDPKKREKLEQENMKEKINLAKKLKEIKEDMEIKISEYEKKLKEKNKK